MITITATLKAVSGKEEWLANCCVEMAQAVRKNEVGCLKYVPYVSVEEPAVIIIVEKYQSASDFNDHVNTPYFIKFVETIKPYLAGPLEVERFEE